MGGKRWRAVVAKPGELKAAYGRVVRGDTPAINYAWGAGGACKSDARVLSAALEEVPVFNGMTLAAALDDRGYDITTLVFSIKRKTP